MQPWPGMSYPLGATYDGAGTNFALFSEVASAVTLCLFDADGSEHTRRPARAGRLRLARLPAGRGARPALRLPRRRAARARAGPALQPAQAAHRPLREGGRRLARHHLRVGRVAVRLPLRRPRRGQPRRLGTARAQGRRREPVLRLARRPPAPHALPRDRHLRGPRQGPHLPAPRDPRGDARHLLGASRTRRRSRTCSGSGSPPSSSCRCTSSCTTTPSSSGSCATTGATTPSRSSPRTSGTRAPGRRGADAGRPGAGVQGDGPRPARRGHRGDPRRRLQPHRRGQPPGPDAVHARHRQRRLLPARRGRPAVLHGLHRHRELAQRPPAPHPAADHGLAALLGHRDARRRLPLRPRLDAGPGVLRRRPAVHVLRPRPAGPGDLPGQADRRAVGRRARRLPGGQLPAGVDRVERQVPRHRPRLLARRRPARWASSARA